MKTSPLLFCIASLILFAASIGAKAQESPYDPLFAKLNQPADYPMAIKALAEVQLELDKTRAEMIFRRPREGGMLAGDILLFLPMARKWATEPEPSHFAVLYLLSYSPEEARKFIIEEIQKESPRFDSNLWAGSVLLMLPAKPIPELQPYFSKQLADPHMRNDELTIRAIERYGDEALLPLLKGYYETKLTNKKEIPARPYLLRFWVRYESQTALPELKAMMEYPDYDYKQLNVIFRDSWIPEAEALALQALESKDTDGAADGISMLSQYGSAESLDPCLQALRRVVEYSETKGVRREAHPQVLADAIASSTRWTLTPEQNAETEAVKKKFPY